MDALYKPSLAISTNMNLSSLELNIFNYFLQQSFNQFKEETETDIINITITEISKFTKKGISTKKELHDLLDKFFEKSFEWNMLGKDKTIQARIKSHFISDIIKYEEDDNQIGITLSPMLTKTIKHMVKSLDTPENLKIPYVKLDISNYKDIKFYPAKVVYEIINDYKGSKIPKMEIETFKEITGTTDKYKKNYKKMVVDKTIKILEKKGIKVEIKLIKSGRKVTHIEISSNLKVEKKKIKEKLTEEEFQDRLINWLKISGYEITPTNLKVWKIPFKNQNNIEILID